MLHGPAVESWTLDYVLSHWAVAGIMVTCFGCPSVNHPFISWAFKQPSNKKFNHDSLAMYVDGLLLILTSEDF